MYKKLVKNASSSSQFPIRARKAPNLLGNLIYNKVLGDRNYMKKECEQDGFLNVLTARNLLKRA